MTVQELERELTAEETLASELENYTGKWVAVRDHAVIDSADTLSNLIERIEGQEVERVFEVPAQSGIACFF
jgi:Family of unknown function (DUF5678)